MLGLGGCVAEERERSEEPTNAAAERLGFVVDGLERASQGCDGTPLPACDGPFTGAACDLPCSFAPPGLPPLECGIDRTCHSDDSTYGLAARNAVLYPASADDPDEAIQADLMPEYAGGTLSCDQDACLLDVSECTMPALDTTAGTFEPQESSSSTSPAETETAGVHVDPDGCDCRAAASRGGWLTLLLLLGARRRRRAA
ncbi:hypothetical protein [Paraliomyxa miuraensis]|uniref:hypothetical protein n=1 Tax=Paraliomyxa miuraensis TaxID=376150 RepID=UPI00224FC403|nr:hypothetical protein [Paraliomyxa miuraensis]MCX4239978.1 hypothetical protein [Paraliomyxa miuraensis]